MVVVFHSSLGLITPDNYFIESGKIIILNEKYFLNKNEYLIFISGEFGRNHVLGDDIIDLSNMKGYLREGIMKLLSSDNNDIKNHLKENIRLTIDSPINELIFKSPLPDNDYSIEYEIVDTDGDVGSIIISNKLNNKFTIEYTGISNYVDIICDIYFK